MTFLRNINRCLVDLDARWLAHSKQSLAAQLADAQQAARLAGYTSFDNRGQQFWSGGRRYTAHLYLASDGSLRLVVTPRSKHFRPNVRRQLEAMALVATYRPQSPGTSGHVSRDSWGRDRVSYELRVERGELARVWLPVLRRV